MTTRPTLPITVVIPAYNRASFIADAVASVRAQEAYEVAQILVVDDASTDDTADRARAAGADVIELPVNGGAAVARNAGIAQASGEWVALLDSDDVWLPNWLATVWPLRGEHVLVGGSAIARGPDGAQGFMGNPGSTPQELASPAALYPVNFVVASATMFRTEAARALGGFRTDLRYSEDFDLWIRLLEQGTGCVAPTPVLSYTVHDGQKSKDPGIRAAQAGITLSYRGQPWWTEEILDRQLAFHAWDGFRAAQRAGDVGAMRRELGWFARHPIRRGRALARLLKMRAERRASAAR